MSFACLFAPDPVSCQTPPGQCTDYWLRTFVVVRNYMAISILFEVDAICVTCLGVTYFQSVAMIPHVNPKRRPLLPPVTESLHLKGRHRPVMQCTHARPVLGRILRLSCFGPQKLQLRSIFALTDSVLFFSLTLMAQQSWYFWYYNMVLCLPGILQDTFVTAPFYVS